MIIQRAKINDAISIASLHKKGIFYGFISSLPLILIIQLYKALINKEIVFVAKENDTIVGYISCSLNLKKFYKFFILKYGLVSFFYLFPKFFSVNFLKKFFETLSIPFKKNSNNTLPDDLDLIPELLSIVTDEQYEKMGIGTSLLHTLEAELKKLGFSSLKVVAGTNLVSANNFYKKNEFSLLFQKEIHQGVFSNVYIKEI
jgi:ribosomal protein S18 acetylase RimI-like enzyme